MSSVSSTGTSAENPALVAGRYRLIERLARGGMGEVWSALDESTGQRVALKRMLDEVKKDRTATAFFMREYQALAELKHPRIIEVYEYGVDDGAPYYTMELLDGQDLRELAPLPPAQACLYLRDVASSLALLHARRLLHRDLSPRNVRRTSDGHCKLIDFGTMIAFGVPPNVAGTPPYTPPEALRGTALDQRSDLYALGALGYFLLTGKHGYAASAFEDLPRIYREPLVRPRQRVPEVPRELDELIVSLMRLDPRQRPRSAADVIDLLGAVGELPPDDSPDVAQSFLESSHLVGRDREQEDIARRLERALSGQGSSLVIHGERGTGRSRLLDEAVRTAQTRGFLTVQAVARGQRGTQALTSELVSSLKRAAPEEALAAGGTRPSLVAALDPQSHIDAAHKGPSGEARARLQEALSRWFCEVAAMKPLLLAVDDVDNADDFSVAFVAALAHRAKQLPVVVISTRAGAPSARDGAFTALGALQKASGKISLGVLSRAQSAALVASLFGDAPNIDRVSDWLYRGAHGNPALTLELAEHLVARGVVRYLQGTWMLPSDEIVEAVPQSLVETLALRLLRLGTSARALAELASVRRGGLSIALALAASADPPETVLAAADELVRAGLFERAGEEYVFSQQAMRESVRRSLSAERERDLHAQLASALLASGDRGQRFEAGFHLVHTDDELRGADILARIAPSLVDDGIDMASAMPALEKALAVYERRGRPLHERLRLRSQLVLAGYLFDYRLGLRYGDETVALLHDNTGLALADRLGKRLWQPLALLIGLAVAAVKNLFASRRNRGPSPITGLVYFARSVMGLIGMRATALDGPGTAALFALMPSFGAVPPPYSAKTVYLACKAFALQPLGREADLHAALAEAIQMVEHGPRREMRENERQDLLVGLLFADGINECYREYSQALERATRLESLGTTLAAACAQRVRMVYHLIRGDREKTDHYRKLLDLHGIQGGTTWQVEWFSVPIEGLAGALIGDLLAVRRALDRLDNLLSHVPSLEPLRDLVRIGYHYRRGDFEEGARLGEAFIAKHPPRSVIGWGPGYALIALSLIEAGNPKRTVEVCEYAERDLRDQDREYYVMYAPLRVALAAAHAALGNDRRCDEIMRESVARLSAAGEHVAVTLFHENRARIARRMGDRKGLAEAVEATRRAALASGNPAIIAMADHLADVRARLTHSSAPPANVADESDFEARTLAKRREQTAMTTFLLGKNLVERGRHALRMLAHGSSSCEAFLYRVSDGALWYETSLGDEPPPDALEARIAQLLEKRPGSSQYVVELVDSEAPPDAPAPTVRFSLLVLADDGGERCVAVAALREGATPLARVAPRVLVDVGRVLADGDAPASPDFASKR